MSLSISKKCKYARGPYMQTCNSNCQIALEENKKKKQCK